MESKELLFKKQCMKKMKKIESGDYIYIADLVELKKDIDYLFLHYIQYRFNLDNVLGYVITLNDVTDNIINYSIRVVFNDYEDITFNDVLFTVALVKKINKKTDEIKYIYN